MAELTEMQFGMLNWVDSEKHTLHGDADVSMGTGTFGVIWLTEKHRI